MKLIGLSILCSLLLTSMVRSQPPANNSQEKMKSLQFLAGDWEGEGWISFGPNQIHQFTQTEKVQFELDGAIMIIEGKGIAKDSDPDNPRVVHNAFAVLNYDARSQSYLIRAYKSDGQFVDSDVEVKENGLIWGFEIPQGKVRYTIEINDAGQWYEIGEFSRDGENWYKNFEMTLNKKE